MNARACYQVRSADAPTTLDLLRSQGYVILEDLVEPTTLDGVCRELEPWIVARLPAHAPRAVVEATLRLTDHKLPLGHDEGAIRAALLKRLGELS